MVRIGNADIRRCICLNVGDYIIIRGYIKNYKGTIEFATKSGEYVEVQYSDGYIPGQEDEDDYSYSDSYPKSFVDTFLSSHSFNIDLGTLEGSGFYYFIETDENFGDFLEIDVDGDYKEHLKVLEKEIKASILPGIAGAEFATPAIKAGKTQIKFVQDISYSFFNELDGSALKFKEALTDKILDKITKKFMRNKFNNEGINNTSYSVYFSSDYKTCILDFNHRNLNQDFIDFVSNEKGKQR